MLLQRRKPQASHGLSDFQDSCQDIRTIKHAEGDLADQLHLASTMAHTRWRNGSIMSPHAVLSLFHVVTKGLQ